ncbi:MAG TPA: hypothetical protein PLA90_08365, partial [Candidatus Sumerlaeota bacterium]|nr:hypothetical protein [Candidatus Sumerlaeota bacterium]HPS01541.1 hypothetical protein [Candidatus Sumerlaeota bacterium]
RLKAGAKKSPLKRAEILFNPMTSGFFFPFYRTAQHFLGIFGTFCYQRDVKFFRLQSIQFPREALTDASG